MAEYRYEDNKFEVQEQNGKDRIKKMSHVRIITPITNTKIQIISVMSKDGDHLIQLTEQTISDMVQYKNSPGLILTAGGEQTLLI